MVNLKINGSKQLQAAMATAQRIARHNVITSDSLLSALAQTRDAGAALLLADHGSSYSHIQKEFKKAIYVEHHLTEEELNEQLSKKSFDNPFVKKVINSPLQLIKEKGSHDVTLIDRTYKVSDFVLHAFKYAQSLVAQQTQATVQTRALLLGVVDQPESNGYVTIFKLLCLYYNFYPKRSTEVYNEFDYWHGRYVDGVIAQQKDEQDEHDSLLVNKLKRADYSILTDFGRDLTAMAKKGLLPPIIGRQKEVRHLELVLNRRSKRNALLQGPAGAGKTAIVEGLAQRIANNEIPSLANKTIIEIPTEKLASLLVRTYSYDAIAHLVAELKQRQDVIMYIDEIANLKLLGGSSLLNMLKPVLARGEIQLIGSTTPLEAAQFFAGDQALERRFENISVTPLSRKQAEQVLTRAVTPYENYYGMHYQKESIQVAIDLAHKYINFPLPDSAFTLLDSTGAMLLTQTGKEAKSISSYEHQRKVLLKKLNLAKRKTLNGKEINSTVAQLNELTETIAKAKNDHTKRNYEKQVTASDVVKASELTLHRHIAKATLDGFKKRRQVAAASIFSLGDRLKKHIIGQDEAVDHLSRAMCLSKAGLNKPGTPIGVYFFAGPTGVGKTELAKQLAIEEYGTSNALIRLNMADYANPMFASMFASELYQAVINQPRSVLLLDEYEKAWPTISNTLLSVFDDGSLFPQAPVPAKFDQTIFLLTSNIGTHSLHQVGFNQDNRENKAKILNAIHKYYSPEFINRLDAICVFHRLSYDNLKAISDLLLAKERQQLFEKKINLDWDPTVVDWLVKTYADPAYGARPLQRGINRSVLAHLAPLVIRKELKGSDTAKLHVVNNQLQVTIAE